MMKQAYFNPYQLELQLPKKECRLDEPKYQVVYSACHLFKVIKQMYTDCEAFPIIAIDCEWVTEQDVGRKPVGLLQIATVNRVFLIQLPRIRNVDAMSKLNMLLATKKIIKVGVGIVQDVHHLKQDYALTVDNWFDIRFISRLLGRDIFPPRGLAAIAEHVLGFEADKDLAIRCSDWDAKKLSPKQITYAVNDVYIVVILLIKSMQLYNVVYHAKTYALCNYVRGIFNTNLFNEQFSHRTFINGITQFINRDFFEETPKQ